MTKRLKLKIFVQIILIIALLVGLIFPAALNVYVRNLNSNKIYTLQTINNLESARVAIVFGAGLDEFGNPSSVLEDRVIAAVELYKNDKAEKLIVSGDNRFEDYNEPLAMQKLAVELGVDSKDVQPDFAGRRTYDTCYRAREIFGVSKAILVTQAFHMNRALFICNSLGVSSAGLASDRRELVGEQFYRTRDIISLSRAFFDVYIKHPEVVLGEKVEIQG